MDMADGSVAMTDLLAHPTVRANRPSGEDLRRITQDISPRGKFRLDMFFDSQRSGYRVRAINGHTLKIGQLGQPEA